MHTAYRISYQGAVNDKGFLLVGSEGDIHFFNDHGTEIDISSDMQFSKSDAPLGTVINGKDFPVIIRRCHVNEMVKAMIEDLAEEWAARAENFAETYKGDKPATGVLDYLAMAKLARILRMIEPANYE